MTRMNIRTLPFLAALALLPAAQGAVIFDNFPKSAGGRVVQGPGVGTIGDVDQATTFEVGAGSYWLTSLTLGLDALPGGAGPVTIRVAEDNAGEIGATLESINVIVAGASIQAIASGGTMLMANTRYWVIADGEGNFDGSWRFNDSGDLGITAGRTDGNPWNYRADDDRYALIVEGTLKSANLSTPVPEPGSVILFSAGIAVVAGLRRRRLLR
ncbi:MAG: PEP-CTERM sorting domain-containing protein [Acidobacteria bacterium]|nr:PEP-CTERM sorting domain-containing protein [Acidobacteriota bacterium]